MSRKELLQLIFAQVFLLTAMSALRLAAPLFTLSLGYSAGAVGALVALFALSQIFMAIPVGKYSDRQGFKRPMTYAIFAAVLALAALTLFPSIAALCVAAMVVGAAAGVTQIVLQRHIGRAANSIVQRRQFFSWLAISPSISSFIGPYSAGLIIDHATQASGDLLSFRICFAVLGCLPLVTWGLLFFVRELPVEPRDANAIPTRAWALLRSLNFRYILFVNWLLSCIWDIHSFLVPVLGFERGIDASTIGVILGAFALATGLIRLVLPLIASRFSEKQIITTSFVITISVFIAYPFAELPSQMIACSVVLGAALGGVQPMIISLLMQVTPPARQGEALGIRMTAINASGFLIPMVAGSFGALIGVSAVFWFIALIVAVGAPVVRRIQVHEEVASKSDGPS
jgi:MFS family permease